MAHRTVLRSAIAGSFMAALLASSAHAALTISTGATSNVSCSGGVCSATSADAVLNVTDVTNMLTAGSLTVQSGSTAQDILIEAPFSWTSSNALTLDSYRAITVDRPVSDAGPAALNIAYNDGGTGGELLFRYKGRISFTSTKNALAINGQSFTLLSNIASMASAIASNPSGFYALKDNYNAKKDGTYALAPIITNFAGVFEGLGNAIFNFSIDCETDKSRLPVGLFVNINSGGAVKSLRLYNISYIDNVGKSGGSGGMVGGANNGYLFDDHVSGTIITKVGGGGLAVANGAPTATISNSMADVIIEAPQGGGLVVSNKGVILGSYATGEITASSDGLAFDNFGGSISQSYATGKQKNSKSVSGGLVGYNQNNGAISQSFSTGKVVVTRKGDFFGGFIGVDQGGAMTNNYWDVKKSGTKQGTGEGNVSGVTGLTTKQFKSGLPEGFDPSVWAQDSKINKGYPYLIANPPIE